MTSRTYSLVKGSHKTLIIVAPSKQSKVTVKANSNSGRIGLELVGRKLRSVREGSAGFEFNSSIHGTRFKVKLYYLTGKEDRITITVQTNGEIQ